MGIEEERETCSQTAQKGPEEPQTYAKRGAGECGMWFVSCAGEPQIRVVSNAGYSGGGFTTGAQTSDTGGVQCQGQQESDAETLQTLPAKASTSAHVVPLGPGDGFCTDVVVHTSCRCRDTPPPHAVLGTMQAVLCTRLSNF